MQVSSADNNVAAQPNENSRFAGPMTDENILEARKSAIPKRTQQDTKYCLRVWEAWRKSMNANHGSSVPSLVEMEPQAMAQWMTQFCLGARKVDGDEYQPNTLYHIICGLMRYVRENSIPDIDFLKDREFAGFRQSLDAEMKRIQSKGIGSDHKQAEPFTLEEEEMLWQNNILGDHTPEALLNTIIYMNGVYFALRSGDEHRQLRHNPCQIQVVERAGERPYLKYTEDVSKNRPGGIKGRKLKPKVVLHHANIDNPDRCFVRMFKKYISLRPSQCTSNAFYLNPVKKFRGTNWFSTAPIGKNKLAKAVSNMCKACNIQGYKTNHSLRATAATRLYSSGVDEQLVMERTGHRSLEGVRSYKRTSAEQREAVSDILSNAKKQCTEPTLPVPPLHETSNTTNNLVSSDSSCSISLPSYLASKTGFTFNSCNTVNISFNNFSHPSN